MPENSVKQKSINDMSIPARRKLVILTVMLIITAVLFLVTLGYCVLLGRSVIGQAKTLKRDIASTIDAFTELNIETAKARLEKSEEDELILKASIEGSIQNTANMIPTTKRILDTGLELLEVWDEVKREVIYPSVEYISYHPLSSLKQDGKLDVAVATDYLKFADEMLDEANDIVSRLDGMDYGMLDSSGSLRRKTDLMGSILELVEPMRESVIRPTIEQIEKYPLAGLKVDGGYDVSILTNYIYFAEKIIPEAEKAVENMRTAELGGMENSERLKAALDKADELIAFYHENEDIIDFTKSFLGNGEDKHYLLIAQNSAELRASGGLPGQVGQILISDGVLSLSDFSSIRDYLNTSFAKAANVTKTEKYVFMSPFRNHWDACCIPDFERAAEIWSLGYYERNKETVTGIISLTPVVIQRLLNVVGEIEISDGSVLDGENATHILQHDLYFEYFTAWCDSVYADWIVDELFAETAKTTLEKVMSNIGIDELKGYIDVMRQGFADRSILVWMNDECEQTKVRENGWAGSLYKDPNKPMLGMFYNCAIASKMCWFLEEYTRIDEGTKNEDGSVTYPITLSVVNTITQDEINRAHDYILGGYVGELIGNLIFFAPGGGYIDSLCVNGWSCYYTKGVYEELNFYMLESLYVDPGDYITITFNVTTAPGVELPLGIYQNPTLQEYHTD